MDFSFYSKQSTITNPYKFQSRYEALPTSPEELLQMVQGLVIHGAQGKLYGISFSKRQLEEELLRTVPQMLEKLFQIDQSLLNSIRPPKLRLIGMCRDYALLLVSFLRYKGIPARLRVGFANYFQSDILYEDHWLIEYYNADAKRWIRMDAQLDDVQRVHYGITFNTEDMPSDAGYLLGGQAWILCRSGAQHPEDFGYNKNWKGWISVKGNLLHDFNSLLGLELLPWDLWTELSTKKYSDLNRYEKDLLDEMAELTVDPNVSEKELLSLQDRLPSEYMQAIKSKLRLLGVLAQSEVVDPDMLEAKFFVKPVVNNYSITTPQKKYDDLLLLKGCRQNNLKNIDVAIPKNKLTVITGVSGSGKSSLAFDTIYAEGKRRYLDNMSNAAKMQELIEKPDFDTIQGLTPTIAIEQKKGNQNPRSTVGTLTGILDFLRMLYVSIGTPYCPYCGVPVKKGSKNKNRCPVCGSLFQMPTVGGFNANTHMGACHTCNGLGFLYEVDPDSIVVNDNLSVLDGASSYFGKLRGRKPTGNWMVGELFCIANDMDIDLDKPWKDLPNDFKHAVLYGTGDKTYSYRYTSGGRDTEINRPAAGAIGHIKRLFRESKSDNNTQKQYMCEVPCPTCHGELLCPEARYTTIMGYRLPELTKLTIAQLQDWIYSLRNLLSENQRIKASEVLQEIQIRIVNLMQVGLPYLTLCRTAPTLSGGELQRVRLSSQLGSDLIGLTYILDEPSIGLHPRDHHLMIETIKHLRDKGNTVIVVEHDRDTMLSADYIIDIGPGAGVHGGKVITAGTVDEVKSNPLSATGRYLNGENVRSPLNERTLAEWLTLKGCTGNNLKNVNAHFPLHAMCCITGVSGSGKSSLVFGTLIPALNESLYNKKNSCKSYQSFEGYEKIDGFVQMDQSPIGKSSRSTPATYIGVFDAIRTLYGKQPRAIELGMSESHFSFNSKDGQCPVCEGQGQIKVTFQYMADHYVTCAQCKGSRYQESVLEVLYKGKNIADVLHMDISEAISFFSDAPEIVQKLSVMDEVGLPYLKLGQSTATLSGGESQRLKLSKELSGKQKKHMVYILDEPTTGLHFQDIEKLLLIFRKLTDAGHTLYIIEHNTDIIRSSDWIIDIGPEGGSGGGKIVAVGSPEEIKTNPASITGRHL
ncbi:excinuclease ABC subunit UvrA [Oscillospiraceae bacterium LTW-04]|nr:excinuclease ABC subunit UvrA [Oscillospiraceae bacterium MB24-C1]